MSAEPQGDVLVAPAGAEHAEAWTTMRDALWPDAAEGEHVAEVRAQLTTGDPDLAAFVAIAIDGAPVGFVEASIRHDYVNGCDTLPVGFGEGLYVNPAWRRRGVARVLAAAAEAWARSRGCTQIASDADISNVASHAFHARYGFEETERVVFFRKAL